MKSRPVHVWTKALVLSLILASLVAFSLANVEASQTPAPQFLNGIITPRIGYPAFITVDGTFETKVILVQGADVWNASLWNELRKYELMVSSVTKNPTDNTATLKVTARDAAPGLYALELTALTSSGAVVARFREPNCVSVRRSFQLPFRVMFVADPHIDTTPALSLNFRRIVRLANFLRPDFIVLAGDVVNFGRESFFSLANVLIQDLEVPIVLAPGNHDHTPEGDFFPKYLAPWYGSLDVGNVHIATLDTGPGSIVGEIPDSQLTWLQSDLARATQSKFKILMFHHPMFEVDNPRNETVQAVYRIAATYRVNIILNGHMHEDIVFHGPVFTLVNPNAYEGGRPYTGFRMLTVSENGIDYSYAGGEKSIPLYDFDVDYSQPNDGESFGIVAELANRLKMVISGLLHLRVKDGDTLALEGSTISNVSRTSRYIIVSAPVTLQQGETKKVTAYTRVDKEPPVINLEREPAIEEGPSAVIVEFRWRIFDGVLGVKGAEMHYSTDNKTWNSEPLIQIEPRVFWARVQFDRSLLGVIYYVEAWDTQGLKATYGPVPLQLKELQLETRTQVQVSPTTGNALIVVSIAAGCLAVATGYAYARRKKREKPSS